MKAIVQDLKSTVAKTDATDIRAAFAADAGRSRNSAPASTTSRWIIRRPR